MLEVDARSAHLDQKYHKCIEANRVKSESKLTYHDLAFVRFASNAVPQGLLNEFKNSLFSDAQAKHMLQEVYIHWYAAVNSLHNPDCRSKYKVEHSIYDTKNIANSGASKWRNPVGDFLFTIKFVIMHTNYHLSYQNLFSYQKLFLSKTRLFGKASCLYGK